MHEKRAIGTNGAIIYTTDAGTSWLTAQIKLNKFQIRLADVCFIDEKRGCVVGGEPFDDIALFPKQSNLILETEDGGQPGRRAIYDQSELSVSSTSALPSSDNTYSSFG